jgi:adenylate kinase
MNVAVCTGASGSERIRCLKEVQEYSRKKGKALEIINMWDVLNEISTTPIDEATILNLPDHKRMSLLEQAYNEAADRLSKMIDTEQQDVEKCVVIATHACFHWKTEYLGAFPNHVLPSLKPDVLVTIIHNMRNVKENLDNDISHRFADINYTDILYWRDREISETRKWGNNLKKGHFIVARDEPPETLFKIFFKGKTKKIYFSYPMSHVPKQQMEAAVSLITELRKLGYIIFDPGSIDDAKYIDKLLSSEPNNPLYKSLGKDVDDLTVKLDYLLIDQSDLIIVRYPAITLRQAKNHADRMYIPLSAGVICEMVHGHSEGKRVYAVWLPESESSPFFAYHCMREFRAEEQLLAYLKKYESPIS